MLGGDQRLSPDPAGLELVPESPVVEAGKEASFELTGPVGVGTFTVDATVGRIIGPSVDLVARLREVNLDELGRRVRLPARLRDGKFDHGRVLAELEARDPGSAQCATSRPGWCSTMARAAACARRRHLDPRQLPRHVPSRRCPTAPSCPATSTTIRRPTTPATTPASRSPGSSPRRSGWSSRPDSRRLHRLRVSRRPPGRSIGGLGAGAHPGPPGAPATPRASGERGEVAIITSEHDALGAAMKGPKTSPWSSDVDARPTSPRVIEPSSTNTTWSLLWPWGCHHPGIPAGVDRQEPAAGVEDVALVDRRRAGRIRRAAAGAPPATAGRRRGRCVGRPERLRSSPCPDHAASAARAAERA